MSPQELISQSVHLSEVFFKLASPKNWKEVLKSMEKMDSFQKRIDCAEKNFKHLSSGSSRIIYDLGNKKALKLASNEKGLVQNKAETKIKEKSKYINNTISNSKDFTWVIAPLAEKLTEKQFEDLTEIKFKDFGECIKYMMRELSTKERKKPENFEDLKEKDIVKDIVEIGLKHKLMPGDIARISSWKSINNVPVLVDLGLSKDIFEDYYEKSSSKSSTNKKT